MAAHPPVHGSTLACPQTSPPQTQLRALLDRIRSGRVAAAHLRSVRGLAGWLASGGEVLLGCATWCRHARPHGRSAELLRHSGPGSLPGESCPPCRRTTASSTPAGSGWCRCRRRSPSMTTLSQGPSSCSLVGLLVWMCVGWPRPRARTEAGASCQATPTTCTASFTRTPRSWPSSTGARRPALARGARLPQAELQCTASGLRRLQGLCHGGHAVLPAGAGRHSGPGAAASACCAPLQSACSQPKHVCCARRGLARSLR